MSTLTDTRLALLAAFRRSNGEVARLRRSLVLLQDALDAALEHRGDVEAEFAADLLAHGPLTRDGRRYEGRGGEGYDWVETFCVDEVGVGVEVPA